MSNDEYVAKQFAKNEPAYLYEDYQNVVIKMVQKGDKTICYAKLSDGVEYEVDEQTDIVMDTYFSGEQITELEYLTNVKQGNKNSGKGS